MSESTEQSLLTLSVAELHVAGIHSAGLLEDLRYRPNKFFHPIESVSFDRDKLCVQYASPLRPLEDSTRLSLAQVQELVFGVIDARQQLAHKQTFYIAEHPLAFGQDEKDRVRIGLQNLHRHDSVETSDEQRSVEAILDLIAGHSPEAQRRVESYRHPVYTLRQLKQVLERGASHRWLVGLTALVAVLFAVLLLLGNYGPPRLRASLRSSWSGVRLMTMRVFRSGSQEWYAELRKDRRRQDRRYAPVTMNLVLQPEIASPKQRQRLYLALHALLTKEFPLVKYQLHVPYLNFSKSAARVRASLCSNAFPSLSCKKESWLLILPDYKGSARPLVEAIREAFQQTSKGSVLKIRYNSVAALVTLSLRRTKKASKDSSGGGKALPMKPRSSPSGP